MKAKQFYYQIALPVPLRRLFDYLPPDDANHLTVLARGTRVRVPFGKRELTGIVMGYKDTSAIPVEQLKKIVSACELEPLFPVSLCDLIAITAHYYHHPIGEVAFTGLPLLIRQGKPWKKPPTTQLQPAAPTASLTLNADQQLAVATILKAHAFQTFLLEGVTGSGKTEVYLQVAEQILRQQKPVLILVPEISLTPQTQERFAQRFGTAVICYHSRLTPAQRLTAWLKIRHQQASIVIGTRSAIFLPFVELGLIIIDEEHDPSFKQQEGFRYCARDVAVLRAKLQQCPIILGSATPSFESLFNAKNRKYHWLQLKERATDVPLPTITLLDVRHKKLTAGLSNFLLTEIAKHCQQGQILLFINRRGFAPTYLCYGCGWMAQCQKCDARMTYHYHNHSLICHHCLSQQKIPTTCPHCQSTELNPIGQGTERIENVLKEHFPALKIARIDSDMTRKKGELENLLQIAHNKEADILIGTQILAKGHHFPHLSMVAIVDADGGLFSVDFRAIERMAQLIIQVAGRAGRVHTAGKVFIQTFHPENPLFTHLLQQDYHQLAENLLTERQQYQLPPFAHFALLRAQASQAALPQSLLKEVQRLLAQKKPANIQIQGPIPAPMAKRQGAFRYQLLFQSPARKPLHEILNYLTHYLEHAKLSKRLRWSLDIDPREMY